jgi:hypothetical protein
MEQSKVRPGVNKNSLVNAAFLFLRLSHQLERLQNECGSITDHEIFPMTALFVEEHFSAASASFQPNILFVKQPLVMRSICSAFLRRQASERNVSSEEQVAFLLGFLRTAQTGTTSHEMVVRAYQFFGGLTEDIIHNLDASCGGGHH